MPSEISASPETSTISARSGTQVGRCWMNGVARKRWEAPANAKATAMPSRAASEARTGAATLSLPLRSAVEAPGQGGRSSRLRGAVERVVGRSDRVLGAEVAHEPAPGAGTPSLLAVSASVGIRGVDVRQRSTCDSDAQSWVRRIAVVWVGAEP